jgi:hypothetical protein
VGGLLDLQAGRLEIPTGALVSDPYELVLSALFAWRSALHADPGVLLRVQAGPGLRIVEGPDLRDQSVAGVFGLAVHVEIEPGRSVFVEARSAVTESPLARRDGLAVLVDFVVGASWDL